MNIRCRIVLLLLAALLAAGCSVRRFAVNRVGDALASGGSTYEGDEDVQLVGGALPFGLKLVESLLAESPRHKGLLMTACQGFATYSYLYVKQDAGRLAGTDIDGAEKLRAVECLQLPMLTDSFEEFDYVRDRIPAAQQAEFLKAAAAAAQRVRAEVRQMGDDAVVEMQKRMLNVIRLSAAEQTLWRKEAEAAYPRLRGGAIPEDLFDEVMRLHNEFRAKRKTGGG